MAQRDLVIGVDVGGTFTDAVVFDRVGGEIALAFKVPSTPADPGRAVIDAIERIAQTVDTDGAVICHGTTVGTNTLIERRGARTALLATTGFADIIELRRQDRPELYGFDIRRSEPLVEREHRFGVNERLGPLGEVIEPLEPSGIADRLRAAGVESVAISFLHAYANAEHETRVVDMLEAELPGVFVTRSSDVCPVFREYERTSTTVVNAYIGPAVSRYVSRLDGELRKRGFERLMVVKSNGGLTSPANAARYPVHLIESGPAAQLTASAAFARATSRPNLVAFDMGGTTAKAGVIRDGRPEMSSEFYADRLVDGRDVGGYAIRSSVLDLVEIGAGGGSIAWIDEANVLKVGPRSSGASPGPACYGRGGTLPTVTDAHAVIGTLTAECFAATDVAFDPRAAAEAIRIHIADPLGWTLARAAYAVVDIAVANMAAMVRLATSQRGLDPRDFILLASGGAGPLHAAAVGAEIGVTEVVIPPYPGMFSALGATLGAVRHEVSLTLLRNLHELGGDVLSKAFEQLRSRADDILAAEPEGIARPAPERFLEARFSGQLFELKLSLGDIGAPLPDLGAIEDQFRDLYRKEYGFDLPDSTVQVVNVQLVAIVELGDGSQGLFARRQAVPQAIELCRHVGVLERDGSKIKVPVYQAGRGIGGRIDGPAVIEHSGATVWVQAGQTARIDPTGEVSVISSRAST